MGGGEVENIASSCSQQEIPKNTFVMHERGCLRYITLCPVCKEPVPKEELEQHHEEEHKPKACDLCGEKFPPDKLDAHKVLPSNPAGNVFNASSFSSSLGGQLPQLHTGMQIL